MLFRGEGGGGVEDDSVLSTGTPAKAPSLKPGQKRVVTARLLGSRSKDGVLLLPTLQDDIEDTLTSSDVKAGAHTLVSLMKDTCNFTRLRSM